MNKKLMIILQELSIYMYHNELSKIQLENEYNLTNDSIYQYYILLKDEKGYELSKRYLNISLDIGYDKIDIAKIYADKLFNRLSNNKDKYSQNRLLLLNNYYLEREAITKKYHKIKKHHL